MILAVDDDDELGPALKGAKQQLTEVRRAIKHFQAPLDDEEEVSLTKQDVVDTIERLEIVLTRREFQRFEQGKTGNLSQRSGAGRT